MANLTKEQRKSNRQAEEQGGVIIEDTDKRLTKEEREAIDFAKRIKEKAELETIKADKTARKRKIKEDAELKKKESCFLNPANFWSYDNSWRPGKMEDHSKAPDNQSGDDSDIDVVRSYV